MKKLHDPFRHGPHGTVPYFSFAYLNDRHYPFKTRREECFIGSIHFIYRHIAYLYLEMRASHIERNLASDAFEDIFLGRDKHAIFYDEKIARRTLQYLSLGDVQYLQSAGRLTLGLQEDSLNVISRFHLGKLPLELMDDERRAF